MWFKLILGSPKNYFQHMHVLHQIAHVLVLLPRRLDPLVRRRRELLEVGEQVRLEDVLLVERVLVQILHRAQSRLLVLELQAILPRAIRLLLIITRG